MIQLSMDGGITDGHGRELELEPVELELFVRFAFVPSGFNS
jgi:hypothetical protein